MLSMAILIYYMLVEIIDKIANNLLNGGGEMKKAITLSLLVIFLGMSGCAQPNMTDSTRTKAEGTGVGVLAGALLGAAVGGRQGAMYGAALGGMAGYAFGSHVAGQKEKYAHKEDWLNACISEAKKVNKDTRAYNASLSKKIREAKKLVRLYKKNEVSKFKMFTENLSIKYEKNQAESKLTDLDKEIQAQTKVLKDARKTANAKQTKRVRRELGRMKTQRRTLKNHTKTLARLDVMTSV